MPADLRLIVGLGNPGERYRNTWHNLGAMVVEHLAGRHKIGLKSGRGSFISGSLPGGPALLIPTAYMNRSGAVVAGWMRYYKVSPEEILVVCDDHDLPLGRLRLRTEGSYGGHRGLEDIIRCLGSDQFARLRIGIRTTEEQEELADQVLSAISGRHRERALRVIAAAADAVETVFRYGAEVAMNRYNGVEIE